MNEKTISEAIVIDRSRQDIWKTITTPESWKRWYKEDDLIEVIPDWQEGGVLHFASGAKPTIQACVPPALFLLGPALLGWGHTCLMLTALDSSSTEVEWRHLARGLLVEDPMLWAEFESSYSGSVVDILNRLKRLMEEGRKKILGPVAQSEKITELIDRGEIDPAGSKILACAMLYELEIAPAVWVGPGPDPYAVEGEGAEARQLRFYASHFMIPRFRPRFIPKHLTIDPDTAIGGRQFRHGERLADWYVSLVLAVMLAELLAGQDLSNCSALYRPADSGHLGQSRFAIVVGGAPGAGGIRLLREYTKPIIPGIDGTYMEYEAGSLDEARAFLATQTVDRPRFYIEVYTPEGGLGKDIEGTYEFDG